MKRRAQVLVRDGSEVDSKGKITRPGPCLLALPGVCTGWAQQVHHIGDRLLVGDDPAYLISACRACNNAIGDPTNPRPSLQKLINNQLIAVDPYLI
jgi:hypothetical protein